MMIKTKFLSLIFLFLILLLTNCYLDPDGSNLEYEPRPEPTWQFEQDIRVTGKVIPSHSLDLGFPIEGQVVERLVNEGDSVSRGDVIASLDTRLMEKEVAEAESHLEIAKANFERVLVGANQDVLIQAKKELIAAQALTLMNATEVTESIPEELALALADEANLLSPPEATVQAASVASAQARLDYLESLPLPEELALAQAEVNRAQASVNSAKELRDKAILLSPLDGFVIRVYLQAYEFAKIGEPIVRISDLSELSVEAWMDEVDAASVFIGDTATVTFETLPGIPVRAEVTGLKPNLNNTESRDFMVVLKLLEVPEGLRWGVTAEVTFQK